jgi:hypothetical protein
MTVTDDGGNVDRPETVSKCDKPQYIYSLCEQGPRVASRINEQGTRWVLLCRKSIGGLASEPVQRHRDDRAATRSPARPASSRTRCTRRRTAANVPHPADVEKSTNLWSGVHGGLGSGIECSKCHDADAFVHSPWIDGAQGRQRPPVVPKMGIDEDYPIGANDTPVQAGQRRRPGLAPHRSMITDDRAKACTKCHRMGKGYQWKEWATRIEQTDTSWENI